MRVMAFLGGLPGHAPRWDCALPAVHEPVVELGVRIGPPRVGLLGAQFGEQDLARRLAGTLSGAPGVAVGAPEPVRKVFTQAVLAACPSSRDCATEFPSVDMRHLTGTAWPYTELMPQGMGGYPTAQLTPTFEA